MNILIIGCGRLGSRLASVLDLQGHDIVIIDSNSENLNGLDESFSGLAIQGNPIDLEVLKSAGVEGCDYVLCLTQSDNQNLMASQIAKNIFNAPYIIARVLDPVKAHVYEDLGVDTICSTTLAFEAVCARLFASDDNKIIHYGGSTLEINTVPYERWMKGKRLSEIENVYDYRLLGFLDEQKKITLYTDEQDREVDEDDCLLFAAVID